MNRITAVIGDSFGVIPRTLAEKPMIKTMEDTAVYDAILRYYHYVAVYTEESHAAALAALTQAVHITPDYPFTLALLADMHFLDYHLFGVDETVLGEVERLALRYVAFVCRLTHSGGRIGKGRIGLYPPCGGGIITLPGNGLAVDCTLK
ncbi:MAG: hypothetical protein GY796_08445 [Chloroflexi bacterium]|nr:hypothetical protein [Chloroflexota bacterium]